MVKILVSFEKKHLYFFLFGIGIIILFGFVMAFNSEFTGTSGAPATFGHSADELMVKIPNSAGSQFTLQNAIDNSLLSPAGYWTENGNDIYNLNTRNVGIGTLTPSQKLDVVGNVKGTQLCIGVDCRSVWPSGGAVSSVFSRTGAVTATSGDYSVAQITGAAPTASPTFSGTVTMPGTGIWSSSGNVGIRASNPTHTLTVGNGGSHPSLPSNRVSVLLSGGNGDTGIGFVNSGGSAAFLQLQSDALYIGTNTNHQVIIRTNEINRVIIDSFGNPIRTDGGSLWGVLSDARLKKNIKGIESPLQKLVQLRGVNFEWKEPEKHGNKVGQQMGFVAQDIEEIFPQWVSTGDEGYKILNAQGIDALTVEAIKEQQSQIASQQKQIEQLKSIVCKDHPNEVICN